MFVKSYSPAAVQLDFSFFVFPTAPIAVLDDFILYLDGWFLFFIFSNCTRRHSWKFLPESLNKTDIFTVHFTSNNLYLPPKRRQCLPKDTKKGCYAGTFSNQHNSSYLLFIHLFSLYPLLLKWFLLPLFL